MGGGEGEGVNAAAQEAVAGGRLKKFAVLLCADESEYVKKAYGGYFKVFVGLLGDEDQTWHLYRASHGELPPEEEADEYDGFVITGSCSDAHSEDQWIRDLVAFLRAMDAKKKKVLGVCFGHQILTRALGGKTGRANKGWDIGVTCIHPSNSTMKLLSSLRIPPHLPIIEFHRDEVWQLPPQAEVLASSDRTGIEMFRYGSHIMGIQGHPEYNTDLLLHLIDRQLQRNLIQISHADAARARLMSARKPETEAWKRVCKCFLKGQLPWQSQHGSC